MECVCPLQVSLCLWLLLSHIRVAAAEASEEGREQLLITNRGWVGWSSGVSNADVYRCAHHTLLLPWLVLTQGFDPRHLWNCRIISHQTAKRKLTQGAL